MMYCIIDTPQVIHTNTGAYIHNAGFIISCELLS